VTPDALRFPYLPVDGEPASRMPRLPLTLRLGNRAVKVNGLVDSGSAINVLPHSIGETLGAIWEEQRASVPLSGSLGRTEARALIVEAAHPRLTPTGSVRLVFAWTRADDVPVIFGQVNFFLTFEICFYRALGVFEVRPR
jgi:hypothetical protein